MNLLYYPTVERLLSEQLNVIKSNIIISAERWDKGCVRVKQQSRNKSTVIWRSWSSRQTDRRKEFIQYGIKKVKTCLKCLLYGDRNPYPSASTSPVNRFKKRDEGRRPMTTTMMSRGADVPPTHGDNWCQSNNAPVWSSLRTDPDGPSSRDVFAVLRRKASHQMPPRTGSTQGRWWQERWRLTEPTIWSGAFKLGCSVCACHFL